MSTPHLGDMYTTTLVRVFTTLRYRCFYSSATVEFMFCLPWAIRGPKMFTLTATAIVKLTKRTARDVRCRQVADKRFVGVVIIALKVPRVVKMQSVNHLMYGQSRYLCSGPSL